MPIPPFETAISQTIWETRYRYHHNGEALDRSVDDTWRRVAQALASVESERQSEWEQRFYLLLKGFTFLPGGRILAGAATDYDVTLFNCFVMGLIEDNMEAIFENLKEGAMTMQQGGGEGWDFSTLRPAGTLTRRAGSIASGPVSFMRIWDSMCATLLSTAFRRGAMMATLRCDHPDIEAFIDAKRDPRELRNFNLSVLVTDDFMAAVERDSDWPLVFPLHGLQTGEQHDREIVQRRWSGELEDTPCMVLKSVNARALWQRIMHATFDMAEPGVLFIDRINQTNNLYYREQISATNPCGEIPLPPYGACNLGSLNLSGFVRNPFSQHAELDFAGLESAVTLATRMLDNVIDLSRFPLNDQAEQARGSRRIGLGITGLANALMMLNLHYGSIEARQVASQVMKQVCHVAYRSSVDLAAEKGCFPFFEKRSFLESTFIRQLPQDLQLAIADQGIRNSHLTAIAPAGTISLFANNISSGIEPVFAHNVQRRIRDLGGEFKNHRVSDFAWRLWQNLHSNEPLPDSFVTAMELEPSDHLAMQAALQPYVDSAISKTINVPENYSYEKFESLYRDAYRYGLKGCTTFRPNPVSGEILRDSAENLMPELQARCCNLDREGD